MIFELYLSLHQAPYSLPTAAGGSFPNTSLFAFMLVFEGLYGKERMCQIQRQLWNEISGLRAWH